METALESDLLRELVELREKLQSVRKQFRDGTMTATARTNEIVKLTDVPILTTIHNLRAHTSRIHDVMWAPEDNFLLSVGAENCIVIWDVNKGLIRNVVDATGIQPITTAVTAEMDVIFAGGLCANVVCLTIRHRPPDDGYSEYINNIVYEHSGRVGSICCIGRTHILTGAEGDGATVWDVESAKALQKFPHPGTEIQCIEPMNPDSATFLTGSSDSLIRYYDRRLSAALVGIFPGHESDVTVIRMLPNSTSFVSGSEDTFVNLYDVRLDYPLARFSKPYLTVYRDGQRGSIHQMDEETGVGGTSNEDPTRAETAGVCDLAVSMSGRLVLSGCKDSVIYFWDLTDPTKCANHQVEQGPVMKVCMSHKKQGIALLTWDVKTRLRIVRPQ